MSSPLRVVFSADTSQYVAALDGVTRALTKNEQALIDAKNAELELTKVRLQTAKEAGASEEQQIAILTKAARTQTQITEDNANQRIAAAKRVTRELGLQAEAQKAIAAAGLKVSESHGDDITNKQRASALLRGGGIRAGEAFLTQFEAFNKISSVVFPVLGAATLVEELGKGVLKLKEMYDIETKLPEATRRAFGDLSLSMQTQNDQLDLTNAKLEVEIAKLEHKPENALKVALYEARIEADNLAESLMRDAKAVNEVLEKNQSSALSFLVGKGSNKAIAGSITSFMDQISDLGNQLAIAQNKGDTAGAANLRKQIFDKQNAGLAWAKTNKFLIDHPENIQQADGLLAGADNSTSRQDLSAFQNVLLSQQHRMQSEDTNIGLKGQKDKDEATKAADEAAKEAARERKEASHKSAEQEAKAEQQRYANFKTRQDSYKEMFAPQALANLDEKFAQTFKKGSTERTELMRSSYAESDRAFREGQAAAKKASEDAQKMQRSAWDIDHDNWSTATRRSAQDEADFWSIRALEATQGSENERMAWDRAAQATREAMKQVEEADKARNKAALAQGEQKGAYAEASLAIQVQTGQISRQDAAFQQAIIHAEQYRQKIVALKKELADELPDSAGAVNAQAAIDKADADRKIQTMQDAAAAAAASWTGALKNANAAWVQDAQDSAKQVVDFYRTAMDGINANIVSFLTSKHGHGFHTTDWKGLGENLAKQGTGTLLKRAEAPLLKSLGLSKADGSKGTPFHVIVDNQAAAATSAAA